MREIKFRAWEKADSAVDFKGKMQFAYNNSIEYWMNRPSEYEVMQFTGLLDRHGKEIYEGDIVRVYDVERGCLCNDWEDCKAPDDTGCEEHGEHIHETPQSCDNFLCTQEVKWACGYFCDEDTGDFCPPLANEEIEMEIIGNIYENSELLKVK